MEQIAQDTSKVDVFIHAAGVEKSRKLDTKTVEEFHQVIDVKADGFFNLIRAMEKSQFASIISSILLVSGWKVW